MKPIPGDNARIANYRRLRFHNVIRILLWFSACAAVLSLVPSKSHATRQKGVKTTAVKGKSPTSPVGKLAKPPVSRLLSREAANPDIGPLEIREHVVHRAGRNETLPGILNRLRLARAEKQQWSRSVLAKFGAQPLPKGKEVHFYFAKGTGAGRFKSLARLTAVEMDQSDATSLIWERDGPTILFQRLERPYDVEVQTVTAQIESSLFEDGRKAGIQPALLSQLTEIFTWDLDLEKGLASGDSVKVLYEKRTRRGTHAIPSLRILAAELINAGQKFTAIYFEKQRGMGGYYDLDGRSLARNFLRFPLEFADITSRFSESRFNPILKTHVPHTGVDFAAERGTPVHAVGDGIITQAGWNGGYGKTLDLQHDDRYMSRYAHLHNFADGIRNGVEVKKGQIIGYVGSTGRSTGPHLHFELYKDQQYVNPLSVDFPAEDTIEPALLRVFDNQKRVYLVELSAAPQT
jgi:murein DD-endopeptidase MepM/ murein hydrolase activator NlpD